MTLAGLVRPAAGQLPWVWIESQPSTFPSPSQKCLPPYVRVPIPINFPVGCFDVGNGRPLDCQVEWREFTSLDEVPPESAALWTGGHAHDPERLEGELDTTKGILWSDLEPDVPEGEMVAFSGRTHNQQWRGLKNIPEASGVVRISATARLIEPGYHCIPTPPFWVCDDAVTANMELGLEVAVPALGELPPGPGLYARCGDTGACTDTDNVSPTHPSAFFAVSEVVLKAQELAQRFQAVYPDLEVRFTDMSLPMGGLFDYYQSNWMPPHKRHRNGRSVDVSRKVWNRSAGVLELLTDSQKRRLEDIAINQLHMLQANERSIHFELAPWMPANTCTP